MKAGRLNIGNISQHNAMQFNCTNYSLHYVHTVQNVKTKPSWNASVLAGWSLNRGTVLYCDVHIEDSAWMQWQSVIRSS